MTLSGMRQSQPAEVSRHKQRWACHGQGAGWALGSQPQNLGPQGPRDVSFKLPRGNGGDSQQWVGTPVGRWQLQDMVLGWRDVEGTCLPGLPCLPAVCSGEITDSAGVVLSPNWPEPYGRGQDCIWGVHVEEDKRIMLDVRV